MARDVTTDYVRRVYAYAPLDLLRGGEPNQTPNFAAAQFDRWLAAHDRQVRAQALRDAADRCYDDGGEGTRVAAWLRNRADAEERGE